MSAMSLKGGWLHLHTSVSALIVLFAGCHSLTDTVCTSVIFCIFNPLTIIFSVAVSGFFEKYSEPQQRNAHITKALAWKRFF